MSDFDKNENETYFDHFLFFLLSNMSTFISPSCFVCNGGGELIICDGCPAAYHSNCADHKSDELPDDDIDMTISLLDDEDDSTWFCPYCKDDNPILYGDALWTKAGVHKWWPSIVV